MEFEAVLSRTMSDVVKSKQMSPQLVQLVLDVYMTPDEWAMIMNKFWGKKFKLELK